MIEPYPYFKCGNQQKLVEMQTVSYADHSLLDADASAPNKHALWKSEIATSNCFFLVQTHWFIRCLSWYSLHDASNIKKDTKPHTLTYYEQKCNSHWNYILYYGLMNCVSNPTQSRIPCYWQWKIMQYIPRMIYSDTSYIIYIDKSLVLTLIFATFNYHIHCFPFGLFASKPGISVRWSMDPHASVQ